MRVGTGGDVYSFVGAYGEAVPPQFHVDGVWVDEVWQMVSVNSPLNLVNSQYFIHQAGVYQKESILRTWPFFSPILAKHCEGRQCSFLVWGQHAHIPTIHYSRALYYVRYRDCGNGVIETSYVIHDGARSTDTTSKWDYFNVPWAGVRSSVFADILITNSTNKTPQLYEPLPPFGGVPIQNRKTAGYTAFVENLPFLKGTNVSLPCGNGAGVAVTCNATTQQVTLVAKVNNTCSESPGHTAAWGVYTVVCSIVTTVSTGTNGCVGCIFEMFNNRTGTSVVVNGVLHYAFNGVSFFFWPNATAATINSMWTQGDTYGIRLLEKGKRAEDNLALVFVHGTDSETNQTWRTRPTVLTMVLHLYEFIHSSYAV